MADKRQVEWLNQNALRNYPIRENAQRRPRLSDGTLLDEPRLPNYLITDLVMSVDGDASSDVYLMKLAVVDGSLTFVFGSSGNPVATVSVDSSTHVANKAYKFYGIGEYDAAVGCLVVGDVSGLEDDLPDGVYNFDEDETVFETRCIRPSARRVSSISIADTNTGYRSKKLYGNVKLVAGMNVSLKYDEARNAIWISADGNSGYNEQCDCGETTTVKTLNSISVEDITLVGDDCVKVVTEGKTIRIKDTCSKPCCGCAELDFINEKIAQINTSVRKLETYSDALDTRISELQNSYVLADTGTSGI